VIAGSLASTSGFEMSALRRRTLRGIGPVTPWVLRRADQPGRRGLLGAHHGGADRTGNDNPGDDNVGDDDEDDGDLDEHDMVDDEMGDDMVDDEMSDHEGDDGK
jgi:hypothetical protein